METSQAELNRIAWEEYVTEQHERIKKYGFRTRQEVIDYVLSGQRMMERSQNFERGWMRYDKQRNVVEHYDPSMRAFDAPTRHEKSLEEWIEWTRWMDDEENKIEGYIPYWEREETKQMEIRVTNREGEVIKVILCDINNLQTTIEELEAEFSIVEFNATLVTPFF